MRLIALALGLTTLAGCASLPRAAGPRAFDPGKDLVSLHYDHAPDLDDGQSAAADRTILESLFGRDWLPTHVVAVSGACGLNCGQFVAASDQVMDAVWGNAGGWLAAQRDRSAAVAALADRWVATLDRGGAVWVKEGGQSDVTAAVVAEVERRRPGLDGRRIHVVQHSDWNERQTTPAALRFVRAHTDYIRISDANAYLRLAGGDTAFASVARAHPAFGPYWRAAFAYYDPAVRIDFSDTGELMHLLGLGQMNVEAFRRRFLEVRP